MSVSVFIIVSGRNCNNNFGPSSSKPTSLNFLLVKCLWLVQSVANMYAVNVPEIIHLIIKAFYRTGLWHLGDEVTVGMMLTKLFFSIYHVLLPLSLFVRAYTTDKSDESIFMIEMGFVFSVLTIKLLYIIWRKKEIVALVNRFGVYSLDNLEQFAMADDKMQSFNKITKFFIVVIYLTNLVAVPVFPFIGSDKKLFYDIAFPLDWRNNDFAFWMAFMFLNTELLLSIVAFLFSALTWYLMISCTIKYEILGMFLINMGIRNNTSIKSASDKRNAFLQDLVVAVNSFSQVKGYISDELMHLVRV